MKMCQLGLIYFYFFNIYICTKRYHGMCKYQQVNFFSNVVKSIKPTYGNKEELVALNKLGRIIWFSWVINGIKR